MEQPRRNKEVTVKTKTGGTYTFSYAPAEELHRVYQKPVSDNGLAIIQRVNPVAPGRIALYTRLMHASGQWMESVIPIDAGSGPQAFGSELTYYRRYATASILNLVAEDDDDGNVAEGNQIVYSRETGRPLQGVVSEDVVRVSRVIRVEITASNSVHALEAAWRRRLTDLQRIKAGNHGLYESLKEQCTKKLEELRAADKLKQQHAESERNAAVDRAEGIIQNGQPTKAADTVGDTAAALDNEPAAATEDLEPKRADYPTHEDWEAAKVSAAIDKIASADDVAAFRNNKLMIGMANRVGAARPDLKERLGSEFLAKATAFPLPPKSEAA